MVRVEAIRTSTVLLGGVVAAIATPGAARAPFPGGAAARLLAGCCAAAAY